MTTNSENKPPLTALEIQKAKVETMRRAIAKEELEIEMAHLAELEATANESTQPVEVEPEIPEPVDEPVEDYEPYELEEEPVRKAIATSSSVQTSRKPKVRSRAEEREIEELALPPHMSSWEIADSYEIDDLRTITLYAEGEPVTYIDITPENLEEMMDALNTEVLITGDYEITGWTIRVPESPDLPPLLSLTSNGGIAATLPLDPDTLKQLVPALSKFYNPNKASWTKLLVWANKHKFVSGFLVIFLTSMTAYSAWTITF